MLIDTSVAIELRDGRRETQDRLLASGQEPVLSIVTVVELEGGVHAKRELSRARRVGVDRLLQIMSVLALDHAVVEQYGRILMALSFSRPRILDRLIAATAIAHDLTLVTTNGADFRDIPDLRFEVWPAAQ